MEGGRQREEERKWERKGEGGRHSGERKTLYNLDI